MALFQVILLLNYVQVEPFEIHSFLLFFERSWRSEELPTRRIATYVELLNKILHFLKLSFVSLLKESAQDDSKLIFNVSGRVEEMVP